MGQTGQYVIELPRGWTPTKRVASTLHLVGFDGAPIPGKVSLDQGHWVLQTNSTESGRLAVCWPIPDRGEWLLLSGTLRPQPQPYHLLTELARGTVSRLRNQLSFWQEGGLMLPNEVFELTSRAIGFLANTVVGQGDRDVLSQQAIQSALAAIDIASRVFANRVVPVRNSQPNLPPVVMAIRGDAQRTDWPIPATCWSLRREQRERLDSQSTVPIMIGPLIDASPEGLAEPFRQMSGFEERRSAILKFASQLLKQLPTDVQMIHAISGLNGTGHRWMSYPQQLQVAVDLMELIDDACPGTESMISFDSPWAERLAWSVGGNSPLAIADTLLRRGLNITAFGLDIQLDYWPAGSLPRDPLQWLELVDLWAQLGLPLIVNLCAPSQAPVRAHTSGDIVGPVRGSLSDDQLIQLLDIVLPILVARPALSGICWSHWRDGDDPRFPFAGMMDEHNRPKRLLDAWQQWRALAGSPAS